MKGTSPSSKQKRWHDMVAKVGCSACDLDGHFNPVVSIHHCAGRTGLYAHWFVLPLCAGHHQDGSGVPGLIAIHPYKARFEARYGSQRDLFIHTVARMDVAGCIVPPEVDELIQSWEVA